MAETPNPVPTPPPAWTIALRHPLAAVIVGFFLTGVIGSWLANHQAELRQAEADEARLRETRRHAVVEISRLLSERFTRLEMLIGAINRRSSPEVIVELRKLSNEAETKWHLSRHEAFMLVREVTGEADYLSLRADIDERMAKKRVVPLTACVQRASDLAAAGEDGTDELVKGRASELLNECRAGSEALVDGVYDLASISTLDPADPRAVAVRERVRDRFAKACP